MSDICPTVTAYSIEEYRIQMERIAHFTRRVHIDLMDGKFAPTKSPNVDEIWWPHSIRADLHLMLENPGLYSEKIINLAPSLVIVHAESNGNFEELANSLHENDIRVGVALLESTQPELIKTSLNIIDHVLVFSGKLGHHGGEADLAHLEKVKKLKSWKPSLEIGWDGGINEENINLLAEAGVEVFNVGGYVQNSANPGVAYATLEELIKDKNEKVIA